MFPEEKLNKDPKLKDTIKKYIDLLNQTKIASTTISNIKPSTGADTTTTSTSSSSTTTATKTTPARDEKGRFVSNKPTTDTKTAAAAPTNVKPISNNYTVTKDTYSYKGKNYPVQIDKQTKEKFFKGDDGRIMDIAALEKMSQAKKKTTGVAEKIAEKLAKQLKSK